MHFLIGLLGVSVQVFSSVYGQAPNTLKGTYPTDRTESLNGTWLLVPMSNTTVQAALPSNYSLLNPANYPSVFPNGFEDGKHPVLVASGLGNDISMQVLGVGLEIPFLIEGLVYIPFVDRLKDGETPFTYPLFQIIGGNNGQLLSSIIPALVGSLEGSVLYPGTFSPDSNAYSAIDAIDNPGLFTSSGAVNLISNSLSGPSPLTDPVYQIDFSPTTGSPYTPHTFHSILNQPQILYTGSCLRNALYFNNPYADPFMTNGTVTLFSGSLLDTVGVGLPKSFAGTFSNVFGYAATGENVGFLSEDCASAAANVDPNAST